MSESTMVVDEQQQHNQDIKENTTEDPTENTIENITENMTENTITSLESTKEWDARMELALFNAISRCKPVGNNKILIFPSVIKTSSRNSQTLQNY